MFLTCTNVFNEELVVQYLISFNSFCLSYFLIPFTSPLLSFSRSPSLCSFLAAIISCLRYDQERTMGNWENQIQVLELSFSLSVILDKFTNYMGSQITYFKRVEGGEGG